MTQAGEARRFGRYELLGVLGEGGFATVYRAWDPVLDREVALKALLPHLAGDQDIRGRFLGEARVLARLRHPHIVTVYDVGEVTDPRVPGTGWPFFTMELIEGATLEDLTSGGALSLREALPILSGLASAVDYLHAAGLVHRDIKATNVMLETSGRVVLMDFGIARGLDQKPHTAVSSLLGTPEVMAPEQVRGRQAGPATDVYALGVLTYLLLSGRPPFTGNAARVLHAHAYEAPPPLAQVRPGLPDSAYVAVEAALAKDPADRPANAAQFVAALTDRAVLPVRTKVPDTVVRSRPLPKLPAAPPATGRQPAANGAASRSVARTSRTPPRGTVMPPRPRPAAPTIPARSAARVRRGLLTSTCGIIAAELAIALAAVVLLFFALEARSDDRGAAVVQGTMAPAGGGRPAGSRQIESGAPLLAPGEKVVLNAAQDRFLPGCQGPDGRERVKAVLRVTAIEREADARRVIVSYLAAVPAVPGLPESQCSLRYLPDAESRLIALQTTRRDGTIVAAPSTGGTGIGVTGGDIYGREYGGTWTFDNVELDGVELTLVQQETLTGILLHNISLLSR